METNPNEPVNPIIWDSRHNPSFEVSSQGLTIRQHTAIQLATGMWANPAIIQYFTGRNIGLDKIGIAISSEAIIATDRLIQALNEPLESVQQDTSVEPGEDDKPSDYEEEK